MILSHKCSIVIIKVLNTKIHKSFSAWNRKNLGFKIYTRNHKIKVLPKLHVIKCCGSVYLGVDALGMCEVFLGVGWDAWSGRCGVLLDMNNGKIMAVLC